MKLIVVLIANKQLRTAQTHTPNGIIGFYK